MKIYTKPFKNRKKRKTTFRLVFIPIIILGVVTGGAVFAVRNHDSTLSEGYTETISESELLELTGFQRPDGPVTVGLQIGHLDNEVLPDELENLRGISTGTYGGGVTEVEAITTIVELAANELEAQGVVVDILPATIPEDYYADAFVSVHADGTSYSYVNGYKVAASEYSLANSSHMLASSLDDSYAASTQLAQDDNITENMKYYYAFNWLKYDHSLHSYTPAAILEVGFLTNTTDQQIIIQQPQLAADGLAAGIMNYLKGEELL